MPGFDLREELQRALGDAYRIDRELDGGGMSRVFLATEASLNRQVVVKVLPSDDVGTVSADRFQREVHLLARLQHPHIVPLIVAGRTRWRGTSCRTSQVNRWRHACSATVR